MIKLDSSVKEKRRPVKSLGPYYIDSLTEDNRRRIERYQDQLKEARKHEVELRRYAERKTRR